MSKKISKELYKLARVSRDVKALASGDPAKMLKRAVNKWLGRKLFSKIFLK